MVALVVCGVLVYALAAELAARAYGPLDLSYDTSVVLSGVVGALLVGAVTMVVAPLRISRLFWLYVPVAGLLGGFLFSLTYESAHNAVIAAGFGGWQVPVCLALCAGRANDF